MELGLVSICSPCYNVASYISRFLDSLLAQTYKHLEIILVNDGSTDETESIIMSYIPRLEAEGYRVIYIYQENVGLSGTINNALKYVHGEYLVWPDPDDWLTPDSVAKRVCFMQEHPEAGLVRGNVEKICEEDGQSLGTCESATIPPYEIQGFAEKVIMVHTWLVPISSMIRMAYFLKVNPRKEIYVTRGGGQNLQVMLPVVHRYPSWQLPDVLGYYLIRESSHSRKAKTLEEKIAYINEREKVFLNTLATIPAMESKFADKVKRESARLRYYCSLEYGQNEYAAQHIEAIEARGIHLFFLQAIAKLPFRSSQHALHLYKFTYRLLSAISQPSRVFRKLKLRLFIR